MFENEIAMNQLLISWYQQMVVDIPADGMFEAGVGHGHPPVWILGHLAICGELGVQFLGGEVTHPDWLPLFGPGSSDQVTAESGVSVDELAARIESSYEEFRQLASSADTAAMSQPHGVELLEGSPIQTTGQLVAHLLSAHFGFHLAQLSSCRRSAGKPALI